MKTSQGLALQATILAILFAASGRADEGGVSVPSKQSTQAKVRFCQDCHGSSGQGYRGVFPIPRLAGQTTVYIESQLQEFVEGRRGGNVASILSKTHALSPSLRSALATHFAALNAEPIEGAPRRLVDEGKKIYQEGVPDASVPACSLCHGQNAAGSDANARLAGQLYPYTVKALANWSTDRELGSSGRDSSDAMAAIAKGMTRQQIEAVAAYLSYLK
jgi:cytochrome c553